MTIRSAFSMLQSAAQEILAFEEPGEAHLSLSYFAWLYGVNEADLRHLVETLERKEAQE